MEVTALCFSLLMLEFILLNSFTQKSDAVFLRITPNRLQHFKYDLVSLNCVGSDASTKLRVHKKTECEPECDKTYTGSSSTIERIYESDSGEYWCETGGERSNRVNIIVTDGSVVLESPVLPVMEGESVTLSCRNKTTSTNIQADFYKADLFIMRGRSAEMTVKNVSKSHEGLYKCRIDDAGESPESWLSVRAKTNFNEESESPNALTALWVAITFLMLALLLLLLGFLHIRRRRVSSQTSASNSVCVEEAADSLTYAVVVTKPRKDKGAADSAENKSPESNQSTKPQSEGDDDESSCQHVYSALTIRASRSTDSSPAEQEVLYAPVQKATNSRDL